MQASGRERRVEAGVLLAFRLVYEGQWRLLARLLVIVLLLSRTESARDGRILTMRGDAQRGVVF